MPAARTELSSVALMAETEMETTGTRTDAFDAALTPFANVVGRSNRAARADHVLAGFRPETATEIVGVRTE